MGPSIEIGRCTNITAKKTPEILLRLNDLPNELLREFHKKRGHTSALMASFSLQLSRRSFKGDLSVCFSQVVYRKYFCGRNYRINFRKRSDIEGQLWRRRVKRKGIQMADGVLYAVSNITWKWLRMVCREEFVYCSFQMEIKCILFLDCSRISNSPNFYYPIATNQSSSKIPRIIREEIPLFFSKF